jgi:hypothetical protein
MGTRTDVPGPVPGARLATSADAAAPAPPAAPTAPPRLRLTRRGRRTLLAALAVVGLGAGAVTAQVVGWPDRLLPGLVAGPECTASTVGGDVALDVEDARRLTAAAVADREPAAGDDPARDAAVLEALRTRDGALSCRVTSGERRERSSLAHEHETASGLTPRAETVRTALRTAAGKLPLGGFAPGGVTTGHMPGSAHYEGRAIDVFFRPVDAANSRHGWLVAQWLVAHAADLDVATVIFDDRIWTASASAQGWRPYVPPQGPTRNTVLRHLDHVHVDVVRGGA